MSRVGRNDPCPCGSGKKFKRCCESTGEVAHAMSLEELLRLDAALTGQVLQFADGRHPGRKAAATGQFAEDSLFHHPRQPENARHLDELRAGFLLHWTAHHAVLAEGRSARELFAAVTPLDPRQRLWLQAQRGAWLTVWETVSIGPDAVRLRDRLTGAMRDVELALYLVRDNFSVNACVLGRIVDFPGLSLFSGLGALTLPRHQGEEVILAFRRRAKEAGRGITPPLLQTAEYTRTLIQMWDESCLRGLAEASDPPSGDLEAASSRLERGESAEPESELADPELARCILDILAIAACPLQLEVIAHLAHLVHPEAVTVHVKTAIEVLARQQRVRGPACAIEKPHLGPLFDLPQSQANRELRDAARNGRLEALATSLWSMLKEGPRLRTTFCLGDVARFEEIATGHNPSVVLRALVLHPFDAAWFASLPPPLQTRAAKTIISHGICFPEEDPRPLIAALRLDVLPDEARSDIAGSLIDHAILSGRLEDARRLLPSTDLLEACAREAFIDFVEGRDTAVDAFDEALARHVEAELGVVLPEPVGLFHIMALYAAGRGAEAEAMAKAAEGAPWYDLLASLGPVLRGEQAPPPPIVGGNCLYLLVQAILLGWSGAIGPELAGKLEDAHARATASGLDWMAEQFAVALRRSGRSFPGEQRFPLIQPPWVRAFAQADNIPTEPGGGRIAWMLTWDGQRVSTIEAREQTLRAVGDWTAGRLASPTAIVQGAYARSATSQDVTVASTVAEERGTAFPRTLAALVGHPAVFWSDAPDRPLEMVREEPRLVVEDACGGYVRIVTRPAGTGSSLVEREGDGRLCVYAMSPRQQQIASLFRCGMPVPAVDHEWLLARMAAFTGHIGIESTVAARAHQEVGADPRIFVRMVRHGKTFSMRTRVRPLGSEGPHLVPGRGGSRLVDRAGRGTTRDLAGEASLFVSLGLERADVEAADLEETLALVERVRTLGDAVVIEWPQGTPLTVRAPRGGMRLRVSTNTDWFHVEGEVTLDDGRILALREILDAMDAAGGRFVALGEGQFLALEETLRRELEQLLASGGVEQRFHLLAASSVRDVLSNAQADDGWRAHLDHLADDVDPAVPEEFQAELRDYQVEGFRWLARLARWRAGGCLADDMGLGKTVQALALMVLRSRGAQAPSLVVAPTSVCHNWLDEAARFAPGLRPRLYAGSKRAGLLEDLAAHDLVVCSYQVLTQDEEALTALHWHTVVLDEAQAIKNASTRRAGAALRLEAGFRLITTGTPIENRLSELWTLFRFLVPGLLGSASRFSERFAVPIERDRDEKARARLKSLVSPFILRRMKAQVLDQLPPRTDIIHLVEQGEEERLFYEALRQRSLERLADTQDYVRILAELTTLRRACCHPRLVQPQIALPSAKLDAFEEILTELLGNGHRALVFSQFTDHLDVVRERLGALGISHQDLVGATPMEERRKRVAAFQQGSGDVFLISLRAGGTGLNLTAASYVIHLDPWWNPAVEDQASDRSHRLGQDQPVTVYRLITRGTIEEKIVELHATKRDLADSVLAGTDQSARLSAADLRNLLYEAAPIPPPRGA